MFLAIDLYERIVEWGERQRTQDIDEFSGLVGLLRINLTVASDLDSLV
jgi:hypothetical protein